MGFPGINKRTTFFTFVILFLVGLALILGLGYYLMSPAGKGGHDQTFFVKQGSTLSDVAGGLERRGIITNRKLFLFCSRLMGYGRNIKAGEYRLNSSMPPIKLLEILSRGSTVTHQVTIPEGYTINQIGELLEKKGLAKKSEFLSLTEARGIIKHYGISGDILEGYLYPDTYQFGRGMSALSIIDVMVKRFREVFDQFKERAEKSGVTMEQVVILASIVEKETGSAEERPLIASVFLNRLAKNMRLESDPTVIYGLKDFNGNLKRRHLVKFTPYNTYVIRGLPAGPIANPGKEAIRAVLYPAESDYLYFVSKNDGTHHFSKTLSEHNKAVQYYQKNKRTRHRIDRGL
ncbi:MAG: endolytic transglycosylase MltG [Desulfobacterales bacterium]|nr:endolytic transglycosylase MltG [Desulfobacterales bacterium]